MSTDENGTHCSLSHEIKMCLRTADTKHPRMEDYYMENVLNDVIHRGLCGIVELQPYIGDECFCYVTKQITHFLSPSCDNMHKLIWHLKTSWLFDCVNAGIDNELSIKKFDEYKEALHTNKMMMSGMYINHVNAQRLMRKYQSFKNDETAEGYCVPHADDNLPVQQSNQNAQDCLYSDGHCFWNVSDHYDYDNKHPHITNSSKEVHRILKAVYQSDDIASSIGWVDRIQAMVIDHIILTNKHVPTDTHQEMITFFERCNGRFETLVLLGAHEISTRFPLVYIGEIRQLCKESLSKLDKQIK
jgi:hypothetical protein